MPRYYRKRYTRVVKPKKKWASNFCDVAVEQANTAQNVALDVIVSKNSTQSALPTPVIVKTGNFKVQVDVVATPQNQQDLISCTAYLLYVPEGLEPTGSYAQKFNAYAQMLDNHPEWVLGWKLVASDALSTTTQPTSFDRVQFSTRLKRNLNSGDSIMFILMAGGTVNHVGVRGRIQFWTCAN